MNRTSCSEKNFGQCVCLKYSKIIKNHESSDESFLELYVIYNRVCLEHLAHYFPPIFKYGRKNIHSTHTSFYAYLPIKNFRVRMSGTAK